jgi:hypothetical protein
MRRPLPVLVALVLLGATMPSAAQVRPSAGVRAGFAAWDREAGLLFGARGELPIDRELALGVALDLSTQTGTPVEWSTVLRYRFGKPSEGWDPYASGGVGLLFTEGGPFFGIKLGGGATVPLARHVRAGVDVTAGPTFTRSTAFSLSAAAVLLYVLP